jgi:hypothetical protein
MQISHGRAPGKPSGQRTATFTAGRGLVADYTEAQRQL